MICGPHSGLEGLRNELNEDRAIVVAFQPKKRSQTLIQFCCFRSLHKRCDRG
jgi:hypothetical protein